MADALFLQILDACVLALNTDRPQDVPEVTKRRTLPGEKLKEPRMAVFLGDENVERGRTRRDPLTRRAMAIAVQCAAPTDDIEELDRIVAPMLIWSTRILGLSRLGGLVYELRETGTQRRPEHIDLFTMTATQVYECTYQTRRDDLTTRT
jgi:hypothetical protein